MEKGRLLLDGKVWIEHVEPAIGVFARMRGLLGRQTLGRDAAMLIERCGAVHTVGMRFAIDLIFLDTQWRVTRIACNIPPGRLMIWGGKCARRVIECETNCVNLMSLTIGKQVAWEKINV